MSMLDSTRGKVYLMVVLAGTRVTALRRFNSVSLHKASWNNCLGSFVSSSSWIDALDAELVAAVLCKNWILSILAVVDSIRNEVALVGKRGSADCNIGSTLASSLALSIGTSLGACSDGCVVGAHNEVVGFVVACRREIAAAGRFLANTLAVVRGSADIVSSSDRGTDRHWVAGLLLGRGGLVSGAGVERVVLKVALGWEGATAGVAVLSAGAWVDLALVAAILDRTFGCACLLLSRCRVDGIAMHESVCLVVAGCIKRRRAKL